MGRITASRLINAGCNKGNAGKSYKNAASDEALRKNPIKMRHAMRHYHIICLIICCLTIKNVASNVALPHQLPHF